MVVSFDPKPIPGDWNGAGAHCNYRYTSRDPAFVVDLLMLIHVETQMVQYKVNEGRWWLRDYQEGNR